MQTAYKHWTLTAVYYSNIQTEGFAREIRNVCHVVAEVAETDNPVEYCSPDPYPSRKLGIDGGIIHGDDVVDRVVEKGDEAGNTDNRKWLTRKETKHHGCQRRSKESFVDAKKSASTTVHVKCKCDRG
jgi:hypothetical protein